MRSYYIYANKAHKDACHDTSEFSGTAEGVRSVQRTVIGKHSKHAMNYYDR